MQGKPWHSAYTWKSANKQQLLAVTQADLSSALLTRCWSHLLASSFSCFILKYFKCSKEYTEHIILEYEHITKCYKIHKNMKYIIL